VNSRKVISIIYLLFLLFCGVLFFGRTAKSQDFLYNKANQDYEFSRDVYKSKLADFNQKKAAYLKNPTLSLKEELRLSLYAFLLQRNDYIVSYLNTIRTRTVESKGLDQTQKETIYTKIDGEVTWFTEHKKKFVQEDLLEVLLQKSAEEDSQWEKVATPSINYSLILISLGDTVELRQRLEKIYADLHTEADTLVSLGRADSSLFSRWYNDIELEISKVKTQEDTIKNHLNAISKTTQNTRQNIEFNNALRSFRPIKASLLKLNNFIIELENVINTKR
jgi:hypothetical protein